MFRVVAFAGIEQPARVRRADRCESAVDRRVARGVGVSEQPLRVGDLLETEDGQLRICKYVGFEPAQWVVPEPRPHHEPESAAPTPAVQEL